MVTVNSGQLPSAVGVKEGYDLSQVVGKWASIANGQFPNDCKKLLQMVDETDRLELWKKNIGGFTFDSRNEFLENKVLIDFDLTEQSLNDIVCALKAGKQCKMTKSEKVNSRADESKKLIESGMTQQQAADELGVSQQIVNQDLQRNTTNTQKVCKPKRTNNRQVYLSESPETAAQKIREKFGDKFADELKNLL